MDEELLSRQQPQSLEAEQAVLGSILIDSRCITDGGNISVRVEQISKGDQGSASYRFTVAPTYGLPPSSLAWPLIS